MKHLMIAALLCASIASAEVKVADGYVVKVEGNAAYLDWGKTSGVRAGDVFDVFRVQPPLKHPVSGESLGSPEEKVGSGAVQSVEAKFSRATLNGTPSGVLTGDRTRWVSRGSVAPAKVPAASVVPETKEESVLPVLWRSAAFREPIVSFDVADIDGDGRDEIAVLFEENLEVYRWNDSRLDLVASYKDKAVHNGFSVACADLDQRGRVDLFVTVNASGYTGPEVIRLRLEKDRLSEVQRFRGFVDRVSTSADDSALYWQDMLPTSDVRFTKPARLIAKDGKATPGDEPKIRSMREKQLFGYAWGDWDGNGATDFAVLDRSSRLVVEMGQQNWKSRESFGGTRQIFRARDKDLFLRGETEHAVFQPRLVARKVSVDSKARLLAPRNLNAPMLRFSATPSYKSSEITQLVWDGKAMVQEWRLSLPGYLSDMTVADGLRQASSQLWVAVVESADSAYLAAYALP
jgi:hypothetical protein